MQVEEPAEEVMQVEEPVVDEDTEVQAVQEEEEEEEVIEPAADCTPLADLKADNDVGVIVQLVDKLGIKIEGSENTIFVPQSDAVMALILRLGIQSVEEIVKDP